ncbi:hypothetical protein [Streptomyces sp. NPDC051546]|uniref:hypothetical protein n=1 Tax=Streptomyces sp. NPDC051546 TaxID=3365655 RepID=UPI0037ACF973
MRIRMGRRAATVVAASALVAGVLGAAAGSASASTNVRVYLDGRHGVGVYSAANSGSMKVAADLIAPASVVTDCFVSGENINNQGNVWYHVTQELYSSGAASGVPGWVYAPYVDDSIAFRQGRVPRC